MLGWTASVSGNVHMNAQYFHNDGKDAETEVLYHEIGHAIDGMNTHFLAIARFNHSSIKPIQVKSTLKVGRHCLGLICSKKQDNGKSKRI